MRGVEDIDQEIRLIAAVRRTILEHGGGRPGYRQVDALLDERAMIAAQNNHREC